VVCRWSWQKRFGVQRSVDTVFCKHHSCLLAKKRRTEITSALQTQPAKKISKTWKCEAFGSLSFSWVPFLFDLRILLLPICDNQQQVPIHFFLFNGGRLTGCYRLGCVGVNSVLHSGPRTWRA
jgi:hypothetical protein